EGGIPEASAVALEEFLDVSQKPGADFSERESRVRHPHLMDRSYLRISHQSVHEVMRFLHGIETTRHPPWPNPLDVIPNFHCRRSECPLQIGRVIGSVERSVGHAREIRQDAAAAV